MNEHNHIVKSYDQEQQALLDELIRMGQMSVAQLEAALDVVELRDGCGFPGMKILQFGFGSDASDEFLPHNWTRHFVAYTGTHDNDTVRGWWDNTSERERAYAGSYLATGASDVHWSMIRGCWNSVVNIAVCQFQDALGLGSAHRMNIPGTMGKHNWSWRFSWDMVGSEPARVLGLITAASAGIRRAPARGRDLPTGPRPSHRAS